MKKPDLFYIFFVWFWSSWTVGDGAAKCDYSSSLRTNFSRPRQLYNTPSFRRIHRDVFRTTIEVMIAKNTVYRVLCVSQWIDSSPGNTRQRKRQRYERQALSYIIETSSLLVGQHLGTILEGHPAKTEGTRFSCAAAYNRTWK